VLFASYRAIQGRAIEVLKKNSYSGTNSHHFHAWLSGMVNSIKFNVLGSHSGVIERSRYSPHYSLP